MKVSLKSVMELAHALKRQLLLRMSDALKLAWAKAKGFTHAAEISVVNVDKSASRVYLFGCSALEVEVSRRDYVNAIARERTAMHYNNCRGVIGSAEFMIKAY